jgi:hypothetical protein
LSSASGFPNCDENKRAIRTRPVDDAGRDIPGA